MKRAWSGSQFNSCPRVADMYRDHGDITEIFSVMEHSFSLADAGLKEVLKFR